MQTYQYTNIAFISYKREDEKWAVWLQNKLQYYKLPTEIVKSNPDLEFKERPRHVFRDVTDLSGGVLADAILEGLRSSKYLIVICSPRAAKSPWVCKEAQEFLDSGREKSIIPFIIDGEPNSNDPDKECFPEALKSLSGTSELLGININESGRDAAAVKVVARMFELRFDTLWDRFQREADRRRRYVVGGLIVAILFLLGIIAAGTWSYNEIKKQKEIAESEKKRAETETKRANREREKSNQARKELSLAYDSIQTAYLKLDISEKQLALSNANLKQSNRMLTDERNKVLEANRIISEERDEALISQSKMIAKEAELLIENGNGVRAINLLLGVLPQDKTNPDRPLVVEAEYALRKAIESTKKIGWASVGVIEGEECKTNMFESNQDDDFFVTYSDDGKLKLWDANTLQCVAQSQGHLNDTERLGFVGDSCVVESGRNFIHIWNYRNGIHKEFTKDDIGDSISTILMATQQNPLIIIYSNGEYRTYWNNQFSKRRDFKNLTMKGEIRNAIVDGNIFYLLGICGNNSVAYSVDISTGATKEKELPFDLFDMELSPDKSKILFCGKYGDIVICDTSNFSVVNNLSIPEDSVENFDFGINEYAQHAIWNKKNNNIFVYWSQGKISEYDPYLNNVICSLPFYNSSVYSSMNKISMKMPNSLIANIGNDIRIYKYNEYDNTKKIINQTGLGTVSSAFFSETGDTLYTTYLESNLVAVWDIRTSQLLTLLDGRKDPYFYHTITFSPDKSLIISSSTSDMILPNNNLVAANRYDITPKGHYIFEDGAMNSVKNGSHPIRIFKSSNFDNIYFDGKGYMPQISSTNDKILTSKDGVIYSYDLGASKMDSINGYAPHFISSNGKIAFTSGHKSIISDANFENSIIFDGLYIELSPDGNSCVTEGTSQIGYWDTHNGENKEVFDFGNFMIDSKYFLTDSLLLVVTKGYQVNGAQSNDYKTESQYWLLDLKKSQIANKSEIKGRFLGFSKTKKEFFVVRGNTISIYEAASLKCKDLIYLDDKDGTGKQFALQVLPDISKIVYTNKSNQIVIMENENINNLIEEYHSFFHGLDLSVFLKNKFNLK